jgi:endonuclease III
MKSLRAGTEVFRRSPDLPARIRGPVVGALNALKALPQMGGDSGAYRMLLFGADHPVLPVDARLSRTARRLGYGKERSDFRQTARSIRLDLSAELPHELEPYRLAYLYLSHHGGSTCTHADPHCAVCPLLSDCPHGQRSKA